MRETYKGKRILFNKNTKILVENSKKIKVLFLWIPLPDLIFLMKNNINYHPQAPLHMQFILLKT